MFYFLELTHLNVYLFLIDILVLDEHLLNNDMTSTRNIKAPDNNIIILS